LLKATQVFNQNNDPYLSCLQAKLTFYNYNTNILTKLCTLEYFFHFNFILPAFSKYEIPIPLVGTSNHLKTSILKKVNGWDEYNVTEDADLTYRLYKNNFKIKMLNSYTFEETIIGIRSWIKQRSRWIKGHIITFLVQSRTIFNINNKAHFIKYIFSLCYFMGITSILSLFQFYWPILLYFFIYNPSCS
jgi:cellulose synthase/poly-beta-1,6-N-acetylglucosamine synthase-like glycosyltransferase